MQKTIMKRYISLVFILLGFYVISSCGNESKFPDLNVDPLINANKQNKVAYYIVLKKWKDSIVGKDSVVVNKNGFITDQIAWTTEHYKYDSINRIIEYKLDSDVHLFNKITYKLDANKQEVLQITDKKQSNICHYKFDKNFIKLQNEYLLNENLDTVKSTIYKYANYKIISITENYPTEKRTDKTYYIYDDNQKLKIIKKGVYGETQYISRLTGLIDSASNGGSKLYYIYHKRK